MQHEKKIAFIKLRDFSHTNESVLHILRTNFPDYEVEVIDILSDLISKWDPLTLYHCLLNYGFDIILKRKTLADTYFRTPYIYRKIKKAINRRLSGENLAFTFQTQSLFDASIPGIPHFLYTDHTHLANLKYPGFDHNHLLTKKWIACEKEVYQNASLNFTMSSNISKSMIDDYSCNPEKVVCVFCGSNVKVGDDDKLDTARYSNKNILFVGIDWERKGGPALVEAFKTVLNTFPDATLTIVGCSPAINIPNCNIVGRIPLHEVKKYFEQASLFCLPTTIEPFGIVFLEAMAHKLPVIGTNIGAIPDFIHEGKNGYLVQPDNAGQIAKFIIELLDSQEKCNVFGEYGYALFNDRYTWEKTGHKMHENIVKYIN